MGTLSKEEAVAQLTALLGEATVAELQDDQWKVRHCICDCVSKARGGRGVEDRGERGEESWCQVEVSWGHGEGQM